VITSIDHDEAVASLTTSPAFRFKGGGTDNGPAGFASFEYSFGSSAGGTTIKGWTDAGVSKSIAAQTGLTLVSGSTYYVNVRTRDAAGNVSAAISSSGWYASGAPAALAWDTEPAGTNVVAGDPITTQPKVKIVDAAGNIVKAAAATAVTLAGFENSTCTTTNTNSQFRATTNPVTTTSGLATFAGVTDLIALTSFYIKASATGYTSICSTVSMSTVAGPAAQLAMSYEFSSLVAGQSEASPITVSITDQYGNLQSSGSDTVTLSFATDDNCTVAAPNTSPFVWSFAQNPKATSAGQTAFTATTYTKAGGFFVKAQSTKFGSLCSIGKVSVSAAAAAKLAFVGPKAVPTGMCSNRLDLQVQDTYGNRAELGSARTINLSENGSAMAFHLTPDCTHKTYTSVSLDGAQAHERFYISTNENSEVANLTATDSSGSPLTAASHSMTAGNLSGLELGNSVGCSIVAGYAFCWGEDPNGYGMKGSTFESADVMRPVMVEGLSNVTDVSVGENSACAIASGTVYCWGKNDHYQVRGESGANSATPVAVAQLTGTFQRVTVGDSFACAWKSNLTTFCWGKNDFGQTGGGVFSSESQPVQVTGLNTQTLTYLQAGQNHVCGLAEDTLFCWGSDVNGQLAGQGNQSNAVWIVDTQAVAVRANGTCWDAVGAINCIGVADGNGDGSMSTDASSAVEAIPDGGWPKFNAHSGFAAGGNQTCVLVDGVPYCWGDNGYSQIGDGTADTAYFPVPVIADGSNLVDQIAVGNDFTCVLRSNRINCWGRGGPQLGNSANGILSFITKAVGEASPIDLW
jgi:hypothetical protein